MFALAGDGVGVEELLGGVVNVDCLVGDLYREGLLEDVDGGDDDDDGG